MLGVLVSEGELAQVAADHVEFDFNNIEGLAIVNGNVISDHVRHDDGISEMGLDWGWLFTWLSILLSLLAFQIETIISVLYFTGEPTSLTGSE